jgi:hypothetical protein
MTTGIVPVGTRSTASLHQRSAVEGMVGTTVIGSVTSKISAMRGTMTIMAPTMTNLTSSVLQKGDTSHEVSRLYFMASEI